MLRPDTFRLSSHARPPRDRVCVPTWLSGQYSLEQLNTPGLYTRRLDRISYMNSTHKQLVFTERLIEDLHAHSRTFFAERAAWRENAVLISRPQEHHWCASQGCTSLEIRASRRSGRPRPRWRATFPPKATSTFARAMYDAVCARDHCEAKSNWLGALDRRGMWSQWDVAETIALGSPSTPSPTLLTPFQLWQKQFAAGMMQLERPAPVHST